MFKYNVSTMTLSGKFANCEFNLYNIGKYLNIDENIIGIKYYFYNDSILKGIYQTCYIKKTKKKSKSVNKILFYNQISLIIKHNKNQINLKLFKNGSIQITGCKVFEHVNDYLDILYQKLLNLQNGKHQIILTRDSRDYLLDCHNYIYEVINNNYVVTGYKYNNNYNKFNTKNLNQEEKTKDNIVIINYDTSPFHSTNPIIKDKYNINIDCINICVNIESTLNLYKLYDYLINGNYMCKYNPQIYSGLKFIYKYKIHHNEHEIDKNVLDRDGQCQCKYKCICINITFLIFQTGNVICTGFKSFDQINQIIPIFYSIIKEYKIPCNNLI